MNMYIVSIKHYNYISCVLQAKSKLHLLCLQRQIKTYCRVSSTEKTCVDIANPPLKSWRCIFAHIFSASTQLSNEHALLFFEVFFRLKKEGDDHHKGWA
jgi:hypothetical protein